MNNDKCIHCGKPSTVNVLETRETVFHIQRENESTEFVRGEETEDKETFPFCQLCFATAYKMGIEDYLLELTTHRIE